MGAAKKTPKKAAVAALPEEDPRFAALLAMFAADAVRAGVADAYEAGKRAGGSRKFGSNGLKVGGKLFALFTKGRLVVKLPAPRVTALVAEEVGEPFDPGHGRKMKAWLSVTSKGASWIALAREAHDFVREEKNGKTKKVRMS